MEGSQVNFHGAISMKVSARVNPQSLFCLGSFPKNAISKEEFGALHVPYESKNGSRYLSDASNWEGKRKTDKTDS